MHYHEHSCACKHEHVKFCPKCQKPFCEDCGKDWAEPCTLQHYYPWFVSQPYTYQPLYTTGDSLSYDCSHS